MGEGTLLLPGAKKGNPLDLLDRRDLGTRGKLRLLKTRDPRSVGCVFRSPKVQKINKLLGTRSQKREKISAAFWKADLFSLSLNVARLLSDRPPALFRFGILENVQGVNECSFCLLRVFLRFREVAHSKREVVRLRFDALLADTASSPRSASGGGTGFPLRT